MRSCQERGRGCESRLPLHPMGIKYQINSGFFKNWTPEMAYVLGYIFVDGSLEDASYIRGKYLRISSKEKEILEEIKKTLESHHNLQVRESQMVKHRNGYYKSSKLYMLRIGDHNIYRDLIKLGLTPRKSLSMIFPKVPQKYFGQFLKGYFDGDGCLYVKKPGILRLIFSCGSLKFLKSLTANLNKYLGIKIQPIFYNSYSYQLRYYKNDTLKILNYMYKNQNKPYLKRKYQIYKQFLSNMASCPSS